MKRWPNTSALVVPVAYFLLTVLMTWPAILHPSGAIPGDGFDGWQNYWNLWWVKRALLILQTNPYFTDYLYAPTGVSLLFHTLNIFNSLWTLPIQLNFGPAIAYNSVVFFSFTLAGYGGYLLSLYALSRLKPRGGRGLRGAAFAGGLVFTMSPFHMAHLLGHMQVFSMIWPPFYILWLLRTLEPRADRPQPAAVLRDAGLSTLFLILATLVDWYHTLYLLLFTGLALLWTLGKRWRLFGPGRLSYRPLLQPLGVVLGIGLGFAVIMSPLLVPMIRDASNRPDLQTGLVQNITLSADLLAFVIPSEMHPLWGKWAAAIADNFSTTTSERLIFAGFVPLALALFIAVRGRSKTGVKFWLLVLAVFAVLALGPYLHVGGKILAIGGRPVPMPYLLLYHTVPFIGLTRSLSRYDLMVMLALGVLVAMAQYTLAASPRLKRFKPRQWLPILTTLLICFEFLAAPYPLSTINIPDFYYRIAAEPEDYTIAELPMNWDRPTPLLHQTVHGKRLLTAYTSRNNPLELAWRTPVFQQWRNLGPDIIDQPPADIAPTIFYDFNLRYIVLDYWQMPPGPEREATEKWVAAALPNTNPIYNDGRLKVYRSPPVESPVPYLSLGNGWGSREQTGDNRGVSRRFVANSNTPPELFLHHAQNRAVKLEITATADAPQQLSVLVNGHPAGKFQVQAAAEPATIFLPCRLTGNGDRIKLTFVSPAAAGPVTVSRIGLTAGKCDGSGTDS